MLQPVTIVLLCACVCGTVFASSSEIAKLKNDLHLGLKQVMMTQFHAQVCSRTKFSSGVQKKRQYHDGSGPLFTESFSSATMFSMHNHHDHYYTIGLGEIAVSLNGVQSRTRHNDFPIRMAHMTSNDYLATQKIEFPDVPPEVLKKQTVAEQIAEMKQYFLAFQKEDKGIRDYTKYFKSLVCYLEGTWTLPKDGKIKETFFSDRHSLAATNFDDLHQKVMFNEATGHKNNGENLAVLPTRIIGFVNDTTPIVAQWNYRILCHPTKQFLYKSRLRPIDDLHQRIPYDRPLQGYDNVGRVRFQINHEDSKKWKDETYTFGYLDKLMGEIPGLDNYNNRLKDNADNVPALDMNTNKPQNAGFYNRWYATDETGAMGDKIKHRGYNDENMFMAMNTQEKVAPFSLKYGCKTENGKETCTYNGKQRWSYAVPMEVIYLTPLHKWNPYGIVDRGDAKSEEGKKAREDGRDGVKKPFDGMNSKTFYMTPEEFFSGSYKPTSADTVKNSAIKILDGSGKVRKCAASGIQVVTMEIPGVGRIRTRYPMMPLADNGQTAFKETAALAEYVMYSTKYRKIANESSVYNFEKNKREIPFRGGKFQMQYNTGKDGAYHAHDVTITDYDVEIMKSENLPIVIPSSRNSDHTHTISVKYGYDSGSFEITKCDNVSVAQSSTACEDRHPVELRRVRV